MICPTFQESAQDLTLYHIVRFVLLHTIGGTEQSRGLHYKQRYMEEYMNRLQQIIGEVCINMCLHCSSKHERDLIFQFPKHLGKCAYFKNKSTTSTLISYVDKIFNDDYNCELREIPYEFFDEIWCKSDMTMHTNLLEPKWNQQFLRIINASFEPKYPPDFNIWLSSDKTNIDGKIFSDGPAKFRHIIKNFKFTNGLSLDKSIVTVFMSIYIKLGFFDDVNWFVKSPLETGNFDDIIPGRLRALIFIYVGSIADLWGNSDARDRMKDPRYNFRLFRQNYKQGINNFTLTCIIPFYNMSFLYLINMSFPKIKTCIFHFI